jgi:hypothetical protein
MYNYLKLTLTGVNIGYLITKFVALLIGENDSVSKN